ncbi:hypothetical protein Tco_0845077, partial [Tanacetum coccineum]
TRILSGILWKVLEGLGSSWKLMEGVRSCRKSMKVMEALRSSRSLLEECRISDEFGEVCLPGRLVNKFTISKVYESLGLFEYYNEGETRFCDVWIMKEGVTKSFTKMLSIKAPDIWVRYRVLELRKNGEAIIENIDDTNSSVLEVYELRTNQWCWD